MPNRCLALALLLVSAAGNAFAWRTDIRARGLASNDVAHAVAMLPDGDAIVVGDLDCDPTALRIERETGDVVWRAEVATISTSCPAASATPGSHRW
jgi:hypothetical protein